MVKIRLRRMGAKKRPFYRLVVADSRSPRDGRFIEQLGVYDPLTEPATVEIDAERVREWMSKGAQPSDAARILLRQEGLIKSAAPAAARKPSTRTQEKAAAREKARAEKEAAAAAAKQAEAEAAAAVEADADAQAAAAEEPAAAEGEPAAADEATAEPSAEESAE